MPFDVCYLDTIYNSYYEYSLPRNILESFQSGKAFDHKEFYTLEEKQTLIDDTKQLWQININRNPANEKIAIITAGAPGAGKTTLLNRIIEKKPIAYACPDDTCLKTLTIYKDTLAKSGQIPAYNKARPASNFAAHVQIANFIREGFTFAFGTTSSSPQTSKFFDFLKKQGYTIRLIHVSAPDKVRVESIQKRDQTFVQTTEEDIKNKGVDVPQRINDTYLKFADQIEFYYRDAADQPANLAATWTRGEKAPILNVIDSTLYEGVKAVQNQTATQLNRPELNWETAIETNCTMIEEIKNSPQEEKTEITTAE